MHAVSPSAAAACPVAHHPDVLAAVVASSDDAIVVAGLDGAVATWNPAAERIFGYTADEMIGTSGLALVPAERQDEERGLLERLGRGERLHHHETERQAKDGRRVPVSLTASPLTDRAGAVVGASVLMRDLTNRWSSEATLRRAHARLEGQRAALATLSRSPELESGDLQRAASAITRAAGRTLGVARASVWVCTEARDAIRCADLYESAADRHSDGIVLPRAAFPAYFAAMEAERIVAAHRAQIDPRTSEFTDSYLRPLGITAMLDAPVWADGALAGVVCLEHIGDARDWSEDEQTFAGSLADLLARALAARERRRAEAALRRSEEQFRSMIENAADLITILGADGTITYESPSVLRVLGYHAGELVGTPVLGYVHPHDLARVSEAFQRVVAEPSTEVAVEYRFRHADGSWRVLESRGTNLLGNAAVGGIVANSRDVTERWTAEARLARQRAELERSNQELEQFAYVASHDLQEPLRKIQAFGDRLAEDCGPALGERGEAYLARMRDAARRMQELITDLLSFSRVATKPHPFRPVDLAAVATDVLADLEVRVQQAGARVEVDASMVVAADPLQCRQLLQNLIGNAIKFRREGVAPVVRVRAQVARSGPDAAATADPWCLLEVEDNGIGFDEKYLDRIFNPFQRLHGRGVYEGTGMGLAICRKIAERHGGTITATSRVGVGTTFRVLLPIHQAPEGARP